jgi:mRNA interferase RelE/StbE
VKTIFRESFLKDVKNAKDKRLFTLIRDTIEAVETTTSPLSIQNLKKLKKKGSYYRIRLGDYRIGLVIEGDIVTFVRFLHRKDIYRYFP